MLKSIATARSECTTKHKNKASYSTGYIVSSLIDFFGDDLKEIRIQIEKGNTDGYGIFCTIQRIHF